MSLPRCQKVHAKPRLQPVAAIVQTGAVCQRQAVIATLSASNKSYAHSLGSQVPNPTTGFCSKPSGFSETCIHVSSLVEERSLPHATDCVQSRMLQNACTHWEKLHVKQTEWLHSLLFFPLTYGQMPVASVLNAYQL